MRIALNNGFVIKGFSVSKEAANVLEQESGIRSNTVASLLVSQNNTERSPIAHNNKELWIVDEASLLGAKDCEKLLQIATNQNARVVFVGDTKQLSSIQAGNPFSLIQQAGIKTAHLTESRRQKTKELKESVDLIAQHKIIEGLKKIDDKIIEIKDKSHRIYGIQKEYINLSRDERDKTLLLCITNDEKNHLTHEIRKELKNKGELTNEAPVLILVSRSLTSEQSKWTISHHRGDVLIFHKPYNSVGIQRDTKYFIKDINQKDNTMTLYNPHETGKDIIFNPKMGGFTSYQSHTKDFAVGDKIKSIRNDKLHQINNGQEFIITRIKDNMVHASSKSGKNISFTSNDAVLFDHNYVSTVYSSQGKTCDRVIISGSQNFNYEMLYVGLSRAKYDALIFCSNKDQFLKNHFISNKKQSAFDLSLSKNSPHQIPDVLNKSKKNIKKFGLR